MCRIIKYLKKRVVERSTHKVEKNWRNRNTSTRTVDQSSADQSKLVSFFAGLWRTFMYLVF